MIFFNKIIVENQCSSVTVEDEIKDENKKESKRQQNPRLQKKLLYFISSKTKQAMNYCLNRWENLTRYLDYSFLTPSTNEAERTVRPFTLLRKNSLFYGSGKGAESSCWILTLIETAKIHNLSPEDYLRCVFERTPYCETTEDWQKLLPWNIKITPFQPQGQWLPD